MTASAQVGEQTSPTLTGWDYIAILWQQRRITFASISIFLLLALIVRFVLPPEYQASVVMVPTTDESSGATNLTGTLAQLGLMRSVGSSDQRAVALATLQSRQFLENFIRKNNLMPVLFASQWDSNAHKWNVSTPPTLEKGYEAVHGAMTIETSTVDSIIHLNFRWNSQAVAMMIANNLIADLNQLFQAKAIDDDNHMISFLDDAYQSTTIGEVRSSVADLIVTRIKERIMAQSRPNYALTVIDPASPDDERVSPGLGILLPAALLLGLMFGMPAAFLWHVSQLRGAFRLKAPSRIGGMRWISSWSR